MSNYSSGADSDSRAPRNEPMEQKPVEITACASNTLHKSDYIDVADYNIGDDGEKYFEECNLIQAWKEQKYTAKQALDLAAEFAKGLYSLTLSKVLTSETDMIAEIVAKAVKVFNACEGWNEDELEVVNDI